MGNIDFLNLEYIILRVYQLVTGVDVDISEIPDWVLFWVGQITIIGMTLAVIFLALIVYVRVRIVFVEHEGLDERERQEREAREAAHHEHAHEPKNPRWERVVSLASSTEGSDWRRAIIEADIILSMLLVEQGYRGPTIGDQLRDANPLQFTTLDLAWKAHKVRNDIAHGGENYHLSEREVRATIDLYKRVFEEFDYI